MSVCALSEGGCGNPYPISLHIHISVVCSVYISAHMFLCLQSLCALDHSLMHASVAQGNLRFAQKNTSNHIFISQYSFEQMEHSSWQEKVKKSEHPSQLDGIFFTHIHIPQTVQISHT